MDARRGLGRLLSAVAVVAVILLSPAEVLADCSPALPLEKAVVDAPVVFIGTVETVDSGGFSADVEVIGVWHGDVAERVVVDGGLEPATPAEDDRRFEPGVTYIFLPSRVDGRLVDNICSATTPWDEASMAGLRPPEAVAPGPVPATATGPLEGLGDLTGPIAVVAIVGGILLVTVVVARRRDA
jgi:hypothetical protein